MVVGSTLMALAFLLAGWVSLRADEPCQVAPGGAQRGTQVFFDKGCASCHSLLGQGDKTAPDLGGESPLNPGPSRLAAAMWNHAPRMWERTRDQGTEPPRISAEEMADLCAFLCSMHRVDAPGDVERGREVWYARQCATCHTVGGRDGVGPDLASCTEYGDPALWVQMMWNHGPQMGLGMRREGVSWPEFGSTDMVDLLAYLRHVQPPQRSRLYLKPGDPEAGRRLFASKGCRTCHDPHDVAHPPSQLVELMWNRAPRMWDAMRERGVARPRFAESEMPDVAAYLYSVWLAGKPGNPEAGARVVQAKGCTACHTAGGGAPDLEGSGHPISPTQLACIMWEHGPGMRARTDAQGTQWPLFEKDEANDLLAHLNARRGQPTAAARDAASQDRSP
ncbi:MAG: c-type cytochrome [Candidatus Latescibacterota bacterium]